MPRYFFIFNDLMNFDLLIEIIQKSGLRLKLLVLLSSCILSSCIGTKYLKKGETILYKQEVRGDESLDTETLATFFSQTPNSRVFVFPITPFVYIYKIGENQFDSVRLLRKQVTLETKYDLKMETTERAKKKKRYESKKLKKIEKINDKITNGNQFMNWGEKLAVYNKALAEESRKKLQDYMFSKGYFDAKVELNDKVKKKVRQVVIFQVDQGLPYVLDSILISIPDPKVAELVQRTYPKSPLQDKVYDQDLISQERDRIFDLLSNNGYFNFKKQYISFEIDSTTLRDHRLILKESIANPFPEKVHRVYKIDSVIFVAGGDGPRKNPKKSIKNYQNITYDFTYGKYPHRILDWRMFVYPDSVYSKSNTVETQKQLSYLDIFKFVNINYDTTGGKFIANIFTSPLKKYQTSSELGLSIIESSSQGQGYPGPFLNFNAKNRNVFQSLEILNLDASASIQGISNVSKQGRTYSRFQYGGQASVTFPQFIFPLKPSVRGRLGKYNPRTKVSLGVNFEDRISEYKRITFNNSYAYLFQVNTTSQVSFKPIDVSFIQSNNSATFKEDLDSLEREGNISYVSAFKSAFVNANSLSVDYNSGDYGFGNKNAFFIRGAIEYGGLAQELFGERPFDDSLTYYKYLKTNFDFRQNIRLSAKSAIAYRANIGIAYVYGESRSLPYEKYFFGGGSNSIRAWSPRRLGPGAYAAYTAPVNPGDDIEISYKREQPGDILVETSAEFRSNLFSIIDYAFFVDAGNVWLWNSKTLNTTADPEGDDGVFRWNRAFHELAVGTGVGLRLDFSFLVLRLDVAYKVFDPGKAVGERFVLDELRFGNLIPKSTLNIGIGYPF